MALADEPLALQVALGVDHYCWHQGNQVLLHEVDCAFVLADRDVQMVQVERDGETWEIHHNEDQSTSVQVKPDQI